MIRILVLVCVGILSAMGAAKADIGAVGNPYQKTAKPAATASAAPTSAPAAAPAQQENKPLVEINFDKNYVDYASTLSQGVRAAEKAKPGVVYTVVSYLPATSPSSLQNKRMNERAETNLRAVVETMKQNGVPPSRIRVMMKPGSGDYDTVKVSVE